MASATNAFESASHNLNQLNEKIKSASPHREGQLTQRIEEQTAKVPSVGYLGLAIGSMVLSAGLALSANRKEFANFVGLWAPSFLLIGIYNKLVKLEGSDAFNKPTTGKAA